MKKILALLTVLSLAVPLAATADTSDDAILNLLQALDAPVSVAVTASSSATSTPPAPVAPVAPKPIAQKDPALVPATLAPGYLFSIDGNAPKIDPNVAALKASLAALTSQFALTKAATTTAASSTATTTPPVKKPTYPRNLSLGSKGADVTSLQQLLIGGGYMGGEATGYFGVLTKTAVIALQTDQGLDQTGFVGPKTRALLNANDPSKFVHVPVNADPLVPQNTGVFFSLVATSTATTTASVVATSSTSTFAVSSGGTASSTDATSTPAVPPPPSGPVSVNLVVSPTDVPDGGMTLATWTTQNALSCDGSGGWSGSLPIFGAAKIGPVHATTDLILTCQNPGDISSSTATIVIAGEQ